MTRECYHYRFDPAVPMEEVDASLLLARFAVEALHGESDVLLDADYRFDPENRACLIDAGTAVGRALNLVFVGFLLREFGGDDFRVERVGLARAPEPEPAACT